VLRVLTERIVGAGVSRLIVHARKAWLRGLSPKQNREIPPLDYPRVWRLKTEFDLLPIEINGGFNEEADVLAQRGRVDGVMLGRVAYDDPLLIGRLDAIVYGGDDGSSADASDGAVALAGARGDASPAGARGDASRAPPSSADVLARYGDYMREEQASGTPVRAMSRHLFGLFRHRPGARRWRRRLAEIGSGAAGIDEMLAALGTLPSGTRYNAGSAGSSRDHP
jgi:tRNA-dihydrouridine synthase A